MGFFHRKNRPAWKSCRNCTHRQSGFGISDECEFTGKEINVFWWTTWDDCELFYPERNCLTCDKYKTCPNMQEVIVCNKKTVRKDIKPCPDYESNIEMNIYLDKHRNIDKTLKGCK